MNLRILMAHNAYARPSGEEYAVRNITQLLQSHGHEIVPYQKSSADVAASLSGKVSAFFSGIYSRTSRSEFARLLDSAQPDLVQVQNLYPQMSASILRPCVERGIPIVMRCPNYRLFCPTGLHLSHGSICERCVGGREWNCLLHNCENDLMKSTGYALRNAVARISGMILKQVSMFIVLSEFQREKFIKNGIAAERVAVIPNFEEIPPLIGNPADEIGETVAFVGRLSPEKGIATFIKAARALPQIPFDVAGDTAEMSELVAQAPANVCFRGFLSGSELDSFYRRTRIFVHPGIWFEGFPNVVTRAMAAGKPVISSRIGAMPEIVSENQTGLLFEAGNAPQLAAHVKEMYPDTQRCAALGAMGRAKVEREYTAETVYPRLMDVYANAERIKLAARR